jgi:spore maturation protein CgeB
MTRPLRLLAIHPGASWATSDVHDGLIYGLRHHGVEVIEYRLDTRIAQSHNRTHAMYRKAKKVHADIVRPTTADVFYKAGEEAIAMALRHQVDAVVVVSAMFFHPDLLIMLRRAGTKVIVLCTESPYDAREEMRVAGLIARPDTYAGRVVNPPSGVWTNERSSVAAFASVNPRSGYIAHAWHPERHMPEPQEHDADVEAHDVVFVGTGFTERIEWFKAIDWTGINLGLYGSWERLGSKSPLRQCVRGGQVNNVATAALYRRAKVNLNFYRKSMGSANNAPRITYAESLNPRAYELAACGAFHLSDYRAEVAEKFGALVPTFSTPKEAEGLIRRWLADETGRRTVAAQLPACVAEDSWVHRARQIIGDVQSLLQADTAA